MDNADREGQAQTPIDDLVDDALEHYNEASQAIHHWNSLIPKALEFYRDRHPTPPTESVEGDGTDRLCRALYGREARPEDYMGGSNAKMLHDAADAIATRPAPESEGVEEVRLRLAEAVRYVDLMHWEIEGDLGALPLVDLLTPDEDESIKRGEDEILNIVDEIVPVVLDMIRQARQEERELILKWYKQRMDEIADMGQPIERSEGMDRMYRELKSQPQGGSDEG